MPDALDAFSPPVQAWFRATFGQPTPPQTQGWPVIQRGENTLILAPTGSGKTIAAFLWGINQIYNDLAAGTAPKGIRLLYVSPLKALNNDVHRNLDVPLNGIRRTAQALGIELPPLTTALRTGDTPQAARAAMLRKPPHILITTPESLYLMLSSDKAREIFRSVSTVIVDEIHTVCGNKRGVHLALTLERLQHVADQPIQRIGLSATQRPLEEVARFLGGYRDPGSGIRDSDLGEAASKGLPDPGSRTPNPVTIVDAGYRKALDVQVITVVEDFRDLPANSIWPVVIPRVVQLMHEHKTTLIFTNSRRLAERTAERLNVQLLAEEKGLVEPGSGEALAPGGIMPDTGFMARGVSGGPIRAHHGSMARETRLKLESDLKAGRLPALVGTSSLELGIDIGSIDLVVQLQSPKGVARGLQRIGRSGHLVGQTSVGRIFATHREDLMEAAATTRAMLRGQVEPTHTPQNCLDVLSQQIVAMVAVEDWPVEDLYSLVRQAYPYHNLSWAAYTAVLDMLSGKYPSEAFREFRPRLSWDRVNNVLHALPGSRMLAISNGGVIPDRGVFSATLADGKTKIGELDEEFVYETRPGDVFALGSHTWRVTEVTPDKVLVREAPGATPRMPFWRGDAMWRDYDLGVEIGRFRREVAARIHDANLAEWLQAECMLDANSAQNIIAYVQGQVESVGAISSDKTVIVEVFADSVGEPRMVVQSPFGGKINGPWGIALASALRERTGVDVEVQSNDDGILLRFPGSDTMPPTDIVRRLGPDETRQRLLRDLVDSAVFGAQFRMNAARALLLPRGRMGRRTPFWLQRLKAKDLLAAARRFEDFPLIAETYRDVLRDVMDMEHLLQVLAGIERGEIAVVEVETAAPSPVAAGLLAEFVAIYMYEHDAPKAERQLQALSLNRELLEDLLDEPALARLLRPEAIEQEWQRLQHSAPTARCRSAEELAQTLNELGDLRPHEVGARCDGDWRTWLEQLAAQGRIVEAALPAALGADERWLPLDHYAEYRDAFGLPDIVLPAGMSGLRQTAEAARLALLRRMLRVSGPLTVTDILSRYAFDEPWLAGALAELVSARDAARGRYTPDAAETQWCDRRNLESIHRRTLTILRHEIKAVSLYAYADFLARWQHAHPATRLSGAGGLTRVVQQLRGLPRAGSVWERDILPARVDGNVAADLDAMCQGGELVWVGSGGKEPRRSRVRFFFRGEGAAWLPAAPPSELLDGLSVGARQVYAFLKSEGACFFADLGRGLRAIPPSAIGEALTELVMAGLVTNDTLQAMREVIERGGAMAQTPRVASSLEDDLRQRLAERRGVSLYARHDGRRVRPVERPPITTPRWVGRWSLVHRLGLLGEPLGDEQRSEQQARQLLARHGIVTFACLEREDETLDWGALCSVYQRMEMRGDVRRGYFVEGLPGIQYALPEAVESLRAARDDVDDAVVLLNATDPANLFGGETSVGPLTAGGGALRFSHLPSTYVAFWRGQPIVLAENSAASLTTTQAATDELVRAALAMLVEHVTAAGGLCSAPRRITVSEWNGEPVLRSPGQPLLEAVGFYRDSPAMTWDGH
jgi:ATP-dependent Lhr-like helicase